jgi:rhodanese-related sulfurtransferase
VPARTVEELLADARARLRRLTPDEAYAAVADGALLVDIRPAAQRAEQGEIPGSVVIERNHLEWRLDPASDARLDWVTGHDQRVIVFCVEGYTSSLAAVALHELGLIRATDMDGGYVAWVKAGLPWAPASAGTATIAPGAAPARLLVLARVKLGEAVPGQVDQAGGDLLQLRLARVQPPLAGEGHHAD